MVALVPYIDLINHNPNSESRIRGVGGLDPQRSADLFHHIGGCKFVVRHDLNYESIWGGQFVNDFCSHT